MIQDKYHRTVYSESELVDALYCNPSLDLSDVNVVESRYNYAVEELYSSLPLLAEYVADVGDVGMFHASMQSKWNMPAEYKEFDIVEHVVSLCTTECELIRVKDELIMFLDRGFESLLKFLKFFVDECKKRNIVLGVGRGSSVSSYVLYLLGVHRVNSIEYGLDINEFLR